MEFNKAIADTVNGSNTYVALEFPDATKCGRPYLLLMGSVVTISYSTYRDKAPVFNVGDSVTDGFAIGNKYVAGSLICISYKEDEIVTFLDKFKSQYRNDEFRNIKDVYANINGEVLPTNAIIPDTHGKDTAGNIHGSSTPVMDPIKSVHHMMRDDLIDFNIHLISTSELSSSIRRTVIHGATFLNNGMVLSVNDLVTESTASFVAKEIQEVTPGKEEEFVHSHQAFNSVITGSQIKSLPNKVTDEFAPNYTSGSCGHFSITKSNHLRNSFNEDGTINQKNATNGPINILELRKLKIREQQLNQFADSNLDSALNKEINRLQTQMGRQLTPD